jgi:dihydroorotate dehydrogenase electron transfer subunit
VDWTAQPLLKRPFGVCRLFFPGWPTDYLQRLDLPATLALALYPPHPEHFDMLYKVLPDGIGTALMTKLKRGQRVHMLGPLGRPFDVRRLRAEGVEEVHVIGGGVGTAPLIQLVESLRYYSFRVKVFVGAATLQSLRYRDELAETFGEQPRDAYIYVDDFLRAGVKPANIFVACDRELPGPVRGIPATNRFRGLVPEQYRQYLASQPRIGNEVAFSCGPNRMMEVMSDVCRQAHVPLKLLLEKRMGCGFGVCFSCVQKVRRADGTEDYARICMEGPVFDAQDILWNNNSQPNLEACSSPARC